MLHVAALNTRPDISSLKLIAFTWDFWPDGEFRSHVSHQQLWDTNQLATNWVLETTLNRGSKNARTWQTGHELRRQCLGVVECYTQTCSMQLAPASRAVERHRQLKQMCALCGETVYLRACGVESSLFRSRDGAVFIHYGFHSHSIFTHSSVHHPDGSFSAVDYVSNHQVRVSEHRSPTPVSQLDIPIRWCLRMAQEDFDPNLNNLHDDNSIGMFLTEIIGQY
jgi:hypothetical protein